MIADAPFNNKSKIFFGFRPRLKAVILHRLSLGYMMNVFISTPETGTFLNIYKRPDYRFEKEKHLQRSFESCHNLYTRYFPESLLSSAGQKVEIVIPHSASTKVSRPQRLSTWGNILNAISAYTTGREILEVGIGEGEFIAAALEMGYLVDGIEIGVSVAQRVGDLILYAGIFWNSKRINDIPLSPWN